MKTIVTCAMCAFFCCFALPGSAQDFGLNDEQQARRLYKEALDIATKGKGAVRNLFSENSGANTLGEPQNDFDLLRQAYRTDPEATLDLLRRIMEAGKTQ